MTRYLDIFIYHILNVVQVYKAVVSWVAHEPRSRASILPALLQHVHFPLMSMDEVEQSSRSHLVKKNRNLATALEEARTYLAKVILKYPLSMIYIYCVLDNQFVPQDNCQSFPGLYLLFSLIICNKYNICNLKPFAEYSSETRLLELQTKTCEMAKNICCDENVLEKFTHGVLRL